MPPRKKPHEAGFKKTAAKALKTPRGMGKPIPPGLILEDLVKKKWRLGPVIGQGGFGYIYLGGFADYTSITETNATYVIKVEPHSNGPLFVELAFYHRAAKSEMINSWMKERKLKHLGIPVFISTGSFDMSDTKYRFMVMDRFGTDIEKIYKANDNEFSTETIYSLGLRMIDALEYIHSKEYVHADIKSSNIMLGLNKEKEQRAYLLDFGLAYRYAPAGKHVPYKEDPKRRHDGTVEYTSRDAHKGCAPSRRGDLEILGYCMLQWLCKKLPWETNLEDKEFVMNEKIKYMSNVTQLMKKCFPSVSVPAHLKDYLQYVAELKYDDEPNYEKVRNLFKAGLKKSGHKDDGCSIILPSSEGASTSLPKSPKKRVKLEDRQRESAPKNDPKITTKGRPPVTRTEPVQIRKSQVKSQKTMAKSEPQNTQARASGTSAGNLNASDCIIRRTRRKNVQKRDFAQSP